MFTAILCSILLQAQPPAVTPTTPKPHPAPQGNWHQWHGRPIVDFRRAFPGVVVVENPTAQVYAEVVNGVVVQTYTLVPVTAAAVVTPAPVVVEHRPWWRWSWRR